MYCADCGARNTESNRFCVSCGAAIAQPASNPYAGGSSGSLLIASAQAVGGDLSVRPENHLVKAILVTLFCCLPFGIASIVQAARVDSTFDRGDHREADRLSEQADKYANIAIAVGLLGGLLYFIVAIGASI